MVMLSPLLFDLALEKAMRMMQNEVSEIAVNDNRIQILAFTDDLSISVNHVRFNHGSREGRRKNMATDKRGKT